MGKLYRRRVAILAVVLVGCARTPEGPEPGPIVEATCIAPPRPHTPITLVRAFPDFVFERPIQAVMTPDGMSWFVIERAGRVWRFSNAAGASERELVLDLSARVESRGEGDGLLAMALHPAFSTNHQIFLSYTATSPVAARESRVSSFVSDDGGATFGGEQILLALDQVGDVHLNTSLQFGPDGYLYAGFGDGGLYDGANAQDHGNLRGKLLRIDVDTAPAAPEIWASGFRNPWRFSFDRVTGELWAGDVGLGLWEEIDRVEQGGNYGWPIYEGTQCADIEGCDNEDLRAPLIAIAHDEASSITMGYVYRGAQIPELYGHLVFADFVTGYLWALDPSDSRVEKRVINAEGHSVVSFAEDLEGELYVVDYQDGTLWRLAPSAPSPTASGDVPETLVATGCFDDAGHPSSTLVAYEINWPFWSGNVDKRRWISIPRDTTIGVDDEGQLVFPIGSILVKEFALPSGMRIETRLLVRHDDGDWGGYSYVWDGYQAEAKLLPETASLTIQWDAATAWNYPRRTDCMRCHTRGAGRVIGFQRAQLDREVQLPSGDAVNQLELLQRQGILSGVLPETTPLPNIEDRSAAVDERARAWLHANCANCHRPGFGAVSDMDLRFSVALADMHVCDVAPERGDLGIVDARRVAPGDPARSVLLSRIRRRDAMAMPPSGFAPDDEGTESVEAWIGALECPTIADPGGELATPR